MKSFCKKGSALLLSLVMVLGLAACGGSNGVTEESSTKAETEATKAPEASTEEKTTAEATEATTEATTEAHTLLDTKDPKEIRAAIIAAAKASKAETYLGRLQDALWPVLADTFTSGSELMLSDAVTTLPDVHTEAPEKIAQVLDWFSAEWPGVTAKEELISAADRAKKLAAYNTYNNTQLIIMQYNTPQDLMRAYASAQPGDLLFSIRYKAKDLVDQYLAVVLEVKPQYLPDGVTVDPINSQIVILDEKGQEKTVDFKTAFVDDYAVPFRLSLLNELEETAAREVKTELPAVTEAPAFKIGFGRTDITSDLKLPLAGYGSTSSRMSDTTRTPEDRLTATAIAISDGTNTHLLYTQDLIRTNTVWAEKAAKAISEATGVPEDRISFSATHTHSGPDIGDADATETAKELTSFSAYYTYWLSQMVEAGKQAMADLAPVTEAGIGAAVVENCNFIRHWRVSDGTICGVNFTHGGTAKGSVQVADNFLQLIRFKREGRPDTVLVNWQDHNTSASSGATDYGMENRPYISSDYAGAMRRYMEGEDSNLQVAFFLGASGNLLPWAMGASFKQYLLNNTDDLGSNLGRAAMDTLADGMVTVETGAVQSLRENHVAFDYGYDGKTREIEQDAITIGSSIAFVTAGYEMFDQSGKDVKAGSPFAMTFVCTCAQSHEYMPTIDVCHYSILDNAAQEGPYETAGTQCNVVPGTAEDLVDSLLAMLNGLWQNLGLTEADIQKPLENDPAATPVPAPSAAMKGKNLVPGSQIYYSFNRISPYVDVIRDGSAEVDGLEDCLSFNMLEPASPFSGLIFDFGKTCTVNGYRLFNHPEPEVYGGIKSWKVFGSNDKKTWTELDSVTGTDGAPYEKVLDTAVQFRYIRLQPTNAFKNTKASEVMADTRTIRIAEFEVFGD